MEVTLNKRTMYREVKAKINSRNLPKAKCTGEQPKLPLLLNKAMEEQSTGFICKIHKGKQNGIALLTNERCTQQLE